MILDFLLILIAFVLGYVIFISTAYFLVKLMLPRIEDGEGYVFPKLTEKQMRRTIKKTGYLAH